MLSPEMSCSTEKFKEEILLGGRPITNMTAWEDPKALFPESYQETTVFTAATVFEGAIGLYSSPSAHIDPSSAGITACEFSYFPLAELFTSSASQVGNRIKIMPLAYYNSFCFGCRTRLSLPLKRLGSEAVDHSVIEHLRAASRSGDKPQVAIETRCGRVHSLATHMIYFYDNDRVRFLFSPIVSCRILFFAPLFATDNLRPHLSRLRLSNGHSISELAKTGFMGLETEELPISWIIPELSPDFRTLIFTVIDPNTATQEKERVYLEVLTITVGVDGQEIRKFRFNNPH